MGQELEQDSNTIAALLDVKSAYDNVQSSIMINILKIKGCPEKIRIFIEKWMKEREVEFIIDNEEGKEQRMVNRGLPQGGVISPILYGIYTSEISRNIDKRVITVQYADDITMHTSDQNRKYAKIRMEEAIKMIDQNLDKVELEIE